MYAQLRLDFSDEQLQTAGLSRIGTDYTADILCAYHDRPELDTVVFPYLDGTGQPVHISARPSVPSRLLGLLLDSSAHKAINCGRVPMPFGLYQIGERGNELGRAPVVLICEGEPDALAVAARFEGAVGLAVPGAGSWQDRFISMLPSDHMVVNGLDADPGGDRGTLRINKSFERAGLQAPERLEMPRGSDVFEEFVGHVEPGQSEADAQPFGAMLQGMRKRGICWRDPIGDKAVHIDPHWRTSAEGRIQGSITSWPKRRGIVDAHGNALRSRLDLTPTVEGWTWVKADWHAIEPRIALELLTRLELWADPLPRTVDPYEWLASGGDRAAVKTAVNAIINGGQPKVDGGRIRAFAGAVRAARAKVQTADRMVRGFPSKGRRGLLSAYSKPHAAFGAVVKATASTALRTALVSLDGALDDSTAHIGHQLHDEIWIACDPSFVTEAKRLIVEHMEQAGDQIGVFLPVKLESN